MNPNWRPWSLLSTVLRPPRHLLVAFVALTLLPASALVWMGSWLTEQDIALEQQRLKERRAQGPSLIVTGLRQALSAAQQDLADAERWQALAVDDARVIVIGPTETETYPAAALAFYPFLKTLREAPADLFHNGERAEHQLRNIPAAIAAYHKLAKSQDTAIRAGALMRLARTHRQAGDLAGALDVYRQAAREDGVAFGDHPAGLRARQARLALLSALNRSSDVLREAGELESDLRSGRWQLDRDAYDHHIGEVRQWLGENEPPRTEGEVLSELVASVWAKREEVAADTARFSGYQSFPLRTGLATVVWRQTGDRLAVLLAGPRYMEKHWVAALAPLITTQGMRVSLQNSEQASDPGPGNDVLTASDTNLPWTVLVAGDEAAVSNMAQSTRRRRLFMAGLVLLLIVVSGGSYFVARAVTRELAVARLQSDFVAAVSHEFRTPLTSLRQVTEILTDGRVDDRRRDAYYQKQARAADRLQRLVESLLDFGRMEAGTKPYVLEKLETSSWLRSVVEDFETEVSSDGYRIELRLPAESPEVHADPLALTHAVRNLLDNAVKYSPDSKTIWVELARHKGSAAIRIRDEGLGIPVDEQKQIFRKFVRGSAAKTNSIKGTGVGLSIVEHIVRAHGGQIELESEPGKGSTFTVLLPLAEIAVPHSA